MRLETTNERLGGCVTDSDWPELPASSPVTVFHNSVTVGTPGGQIHGRASGTFNVGGVGGFLGEYQGEISAQYQYDAGGNPQIILVDDRGTWTASDGATAWGTFHIVLDRIGFSDSLPILVGTLTLKGIHN